MAGVPAGRGRFMKNLRDYSFPTDQIRPDREIRMTREAERSRSELTDKKNCSRVETEGPIRTKIAQLFGGNFPNCQYIC